MLKGNCKIVNWLVLFFGSFNSNSFSLEERDVALW